MTYILGISLAACIPTLITLSVLYVRAGHESASERLRRGEAELDLARCGAELRASEEQRARLSKAIARYSRELKELQEYCITVGDADAVRRRLDDMLSPSTEGGQGAGDGTAGGPVPDWAAPDATGSTDDSV